MTAPQRASPRQRAVGALVSSVFLLFGLGLAVPFFGRPLVRVWQARSWTQVGCVIESSGLRGDGDTYQVVARYRYQVGGDTFTGTRVQFQGGASTGRESKQELVDRLVPGGTVPCWVDPGHPDQAVLDRGLTGDMWFALIPMVFALIGAVGLYGSVRGRGFVPPDDAADGLPPEARVGREARLLRPEVSARARLIVFTIGAVFWNGVLQSFVRSVIDEWRRGQRPYFMTLFLVPFVVTGVGLVVKAVRMLLAQWNPRPLLTLSPGRLVPGERGSLEWELAGSVERLRRLRVTLEGREETRKDSEDKWAPSVFATVPLFDEAMQGTARRGSARIPVPVDARPSSLASRKRVVWVVKVHGEIAGWPDLEEEFPVGVRAE